MILVLILTSAAFHSIWNVMVRASGDRDAVIFNVAFVSTLGSWAWLLVYEGFGPVDSLGMTWCVGAGLFEVFTFVALAKAYHAGPVGPAYAIARGAAPLLLLPFSMAYMGESPKPTAIGAMLVVATGVLILGKRKAPALPAPVAGADPGAGPTPTGPQPPAARPVTYYVMAFTAAACIATFNGFYKLASMQGIGPAAMYCYAMTLTLPLQLFFLRGHPAGTPAAADGTRPEPHPHIALHRIAAAFKKHPIYCVVGGMICTLSFLLYLIAVHQGGIGVGALTSLRTLSIPVAGIIALTVLKEKLGRREWLGIATITVGIIALSYFSAPGH